MNTAVVLLGNFVGNFAYDQNWISVTPIFHCCQHVRFPHLSTPSLAAPTLSNHFMRKCVYYTSIFHLSCLSQCQITGPWPRNYPGLALTTVASYSLISVIWTLFSFTVQNTIAKITALIAVMSLPPSPLWITSLVCVCTGHNTSPCFQSPILWSPSVHHLPHLSHPCHSANDALSKIPLVSWPTVDSLPSSMLPLTFGPPSSKICLSHLQPQLFHITAKISLLPLCLQKIHVHFLILKKWTT